MLRRCVFLLSLCVGPVACGDGGEEPGPSGGAGNTSGGSSAGSGGGATAGDGGTAGSDVGGAMNGGGGDGGGAGPATPDCSGSFGEPELAFEDGELFANSLSPTGDELELFYFTYDPNSASRQLARRARDTRAAAFGPRLDIPELANLCGSQDISSLEISDDGLRLYVSCAEEAAAMAVSSTLYVAQRASRSAAFVPGEQTLGTVNLSIGIARDELTLYSVTDAPQLTVQERSSITEAFGSPTSVAGADVEFRTPEPSPDGLSLFGVVSDAASGGRISVMTRASQTAPFASPTTEGMPTAPAGQGAGDGSPAISADCRTLYFVRLPEVGSKWSVYVARR